MGAVVVVVWWMKKRMRRVHWLGSLLCFSLLTLLVFVTRRTFCFFKKSAIKKICDGYFQTFCFWNKYGKEPRENELNIIVAIKW